ncbi:hypothetical protein GCM10009784_05830 [Arthrobacter parietis]|uniref:Uncharacterized protein n=1 Tax=Arthrobacter parietis TaxID=271434 RepID=A0ABN3AQC9_9MICC
MGFESYEPEQRQGLSEVLARADITTGELWLRYFSIGGSAGEYEVDAYLQSLISLPKLERDLLAMAANELCADGSGPRAPYSDELPPADAPQD